MKLLVLFGSLLITNFSYSQSSCQALYDEPYAHNFNFGKYKNFAELQKSEQEGRDYSLLIHDVGSPITVMAIHGGRMEIGTTELAKALAEHTYNLYSFEARRDNPEELHITSTKYNEPKGIALATRSRLNVSLHGFPEAQKCAICLGGANKELAEKIVELIKEKGLPDWEMEYPCKLYPGIHAKNIANLSSEKGVQLELSLKLREDLLASKEKFDLFIQILKEAIAD